MWVTPAPELDEDRNPSTELVDQAAALLRPATELGEDRNAPFVDWQAPSVAAAPSH